MCQNCLHAWTVTRWHMAKLFIQRALSVRSLSRLGSVRRDQDTYASREEGLL